MNQSNNTPKMNYNLTPGSQAVADAIYAEQEANGGIGASLKDICIDTGFSANVVKGHLGDLFKKDVITVDLAEYSSFLEHDLYYHNDWSE
jgi:hypothetical protein